MMECDDLPEQLKKGTIENGWYKFGKYRVRVIPLKPLSASERVKRYYERNPEALEKKKKKQREKYRERKENGLCVKCGDKVFDDRVMCVSCRRRLRR